MSPFRRVGRLTPLGWTLVALVAGATLARGANDVLSRTDRHYLTEAAELAGRAQPLALLAVTRGSHAEVRDLARDILVYHKAADADLARLAAAAHVTLPEPKPAPLDKWSRKDVGEFDRDYVDQVISSHNDTISLLEAAARKAEAPDIAAYARHHLVPLQAQLRAAKELRKQLD